jgi:uncharacterized protein YjfI (DUF2170 family)
MLYKRFIIIHCSGNFVTGLVIIEKAKYFCGEMKITDRPTFSEGSLKNQSYKDLSSIGIV